MDSTARVNVSKEEDEESTTITSEDKESTTASTSSSGEDDPSSSHEDEESPTPSSSSEEERETTLWEHQGNSYWVCPETLIVYDDGSVKEIGKWGEGMFEDATDFGDDYSYL